MNFTIEQIKKMKVKHGDIFLVSVDDKSCILHKPTRQDLSYVSAVKDPIKMNEVLLKQLWVDGDKEMLEDDELFMAVSSKLETVLKIKEADIKKL